MKTEICNRLKCEVPIFAFSHCRDVVVEVTKAGGFGVLGAVSHSPEQLEQELTWIDRHLPGKSYGVDVLIPSSYDRAAEVSDGYLQALIPPAQRDFLDQFLRSEDVPELPTDMKAEWDRQYNERARNNTPAAARRLIDVALRHPQVTFIVSALGSPPIDIVQEFHQRGILVGALCGKPAHAARHVEVGVDVVIAQGTEAGGHTGDISTMVLLPQVVDAVEDKAMVLAAGGISRGSQVAAAIAMGAQGVWCGTIWLATRESELSPLSKEVLFAAKTEDAVRRKWQTGKPVRLIRSKTSEAWESPAAPPHLPAPLQSLLYYESKARIERAGRADLLSFPAGQVVGTLSQETSVRETMHTLLHEYLSAVERVHGLGEQA